MKIILISLQKALGASIFFSPVFRLLRKGFPDAQLDLLINKAHSELYLHNPYINNLITLDRQEYLNDFKKYLQLIRKVRAGHYDISINLYRIKKTVLLNLFSGAKTKCDIAARGIYGCLFTHRIKGELRHVVDPFLAMMDSLNISDDGQGMELWIDQTSIAELNKLWFVKGLDRKKNIIGINPAAGKEKKCWTIDGFVQLIDLLDRASYTPIIFGGPKDKAIAAAICSKTISKPVCLTGKLTVLQLAAAIDKCDLLVTGDSGPMHIAAALKKPTVALFGPTNHVLYGPYKTAHIILKKDYHCFKCRAERCKKFNGKCLSQISAAEVFHAVNELLKAKV